MEKGKKIIKVMDTTNYSLRTNKGFTLMEVVVALGVFVMIVTSIVGISVAISRAQRKAVSIQDVQDNLRFSLEFMTREMRTSAAFSQTSLSDISFTNQSGEEITYRLNGEKAERSVDGGGFQDFIAGNIAVDGLNFYLSGEEAGDRTQTLVTITMKLRSKGLFSTTSDVQMTITPRVLDQ